mmetsp:Transcript_44275/g.88870  ORF Transcript_44275/g.88870 Transcript_44275/m.88870 type:complete len:257 (+) Transcript_44275:3-773(+)
MLKVSSRNGFVSALLASRTSHVLARPRRSHAYSRTQEFSTSPVRLGQASQDANAPLRGVVFDLDGTLTKEGSLDFDEMYRRAGKPPAEKNILAWVETLPLDEKAKAEKAIREVEREGYQRQELTTNCKAMLEQLRKRPLKLAILTRNSDEGVQIFLDMFGLHNTFAATFSRDWKLGRAKPHPDALLHVAEEWSLAPQQIMMVGDWKDDIEAGLAAGTRTCLKRNPHSKQRDNSGITSADFDVQDLLELVPLVDRLV